MKQLILICSIVSIFIVSIYGQDWSSQGGNTFNSRYVPLNQTKISTTTLNLVKGPRFKFTVGGQIHTTPVS